jgi:nitrogen regulatory protein P-II 1
LSFSSPAKRLIREAVQLVLLSSGFAGLKEYPMKLVIAIIQSSKLDAVMKALDEKEIYLKTVSNVLGCGRQKGVSEIYRGVREAGNLIKKVRLEIGVNDAYLEATIEAITKAAQTGKIGDGKIFILDLAECVRIRTGERGKLAIG